jgi:hypothetical protein
MGKKSPAPPPAPDYAGAAQQQGIANLEAARLTARLSNPNVITPLGGQRVTFGRPQFNMNAYNAAMADWRARNPQAQPPAGGTMPTTRAPTAPTTGTTGVPPTTPLGGGMYGPTTGVQPLAAPSMQPPLQVPTDGREPPDRTDFAPRGPYSFDGENRIGGPTDDIYRIAPNQAMPITDFGGKREAVIGEPSDREYAFEGPGAQTRAAQMYTTAAGNQVPVGMLTDFGGSRLDSSGMGPGAATRAAQGYDPSFSQYGYTGDVMPTREMFTEMVDLDTPTIEQYLTPEAQATLEAQQRVERALSGLGEQAIGKVGNIYGTTFTPQGLPEQQFRFEGGGPLPTAPTLQGTARADVSALPTAFGPTAEQYGMAAGAVGAPTLQGQLDVSNLAAMPVSAGTTAQEAIMSRLDPQLQRQRAQLETQLANQGLVRGGEAYNAAIQEQAQRENDLRTQAALQGISLDMAARQQGLGEAQALGGFAQQAALAGFGAQQQAQQARNAAIAQNFQQGLQAQGAYNAAAAQQFGQGMDIAGLYNAALAQNQQTALQQAQAQAALQAQGFNQAQAQAAFQNAQRQAALQEQLALRAQPLNEIAAIMGGAQVQMPQFQGYTGAAVEAAPIFGATQAAGQFAQQNYANQVAQRNAQMGMYGQLGGALGSAIGGGGISGLFK